MGGQRETCDDEAAQKEGEASQFCRVDAGKTMLELMMRFDVMSKLERWMYRYIPDLIPRVSAGLDQSGIACTWPCALRCGSAQTPAGYCPIRGGKNG
jgi:hypothetical protein